MCACVRVRVCVCVCVCARARAARDGCQQRCVNQGHRQAAGPHLVGHLAEDVCLHHRLLERCVPLDL